MSEVLLSVTTDPGQVSAVLSDRYRLRVDAPTGAQLTCLDTADWRLHSAGLTLQDARHGRQGQLLLYHGGSDVPLTTDAPAPRWPRAVQSLPPSPVRDELARAAGVRALLPLAQVNVRTVGMHLLDAEDKTRVRVRVEQQRLAGDPAIPLPLRVVVLPLRGYERDARRCADLLAEALPIQSDAASAAELAFAAAGHIPGTPAVPPVTLSPAAPAIASVAAVLRRWSDVIDQVRPGVIADIDIEYLHDLRTAVRATRSMLRVCEDLLPADEVARFAAEFAWLGKLTTPLRDLDVAMLDYTGRGSLDLSGLDGASALAPLHTRVNSQRRRALQAVRAGLDSSRGRAMSADWPATLDRLGRAEGVGPATSKVASAQARRAYKRIVAAASGVTAQTPADELHRLRRRCKQMRYVLDGYASVYDREPHRRVLRALKGLQDCLGDIQDVEVQRHQIIEFADALNKRGVPAETVLAMGALRERSRDRDAAARRRIVQRLEQFRSHAMRTAVRSLVPTGG
jgi:CHAD domain-containing protein